MLVNDGQLDEIFLIILHTQELEKAGVSLLKETKSRDPART